jgi:hypothetical protein
MKKTFTTNLFYKQYAYKILLEDKINKQTINSHWMSSRHFRRWFYDNSMAHKLVWDTDWTAWYKGEDARSNVRIYLKNETDYNSVINAFKQHVVEITQPFHVSHIELMKSNASIRIKPRLIYGKFRYVIIFNQWLNDETAEAISSWITSSLDYENTNNIRFIPKRKPFIQQWAFAQSMRLYLRDETDLIMTKLAWQDEIKQIQLIFLQSEAGDVTAVQP